MGVKIDIKEISLTGSKNLYDENNNIIGELRSACYSPHFQNGYRNSNDPEISLGSLSKL